MAAIAGFFAILEKFMEDRTKDEIAQYIFEYKDVSFHAFERDVIRGLMQPFLKDGRLRKFRVYLLSLGLILLFFGLFDLNTFAAIGMERSGSGFLGIFWGTPSSLQLNVGKPALDLQRKVL